MCNNVKKKNIYYKFNFSLNWTVKLGSCQKIKNKSKHLEIIGCQKNLMAM